MEEVAAVRFVSASPRHQRDRFRFVRLQLDLAVRRRAGSDAGRSEELPRGEVVAAA